MIGSLETIRKDGVASQMKHVANQIASVTADDDTHVTLIFKQRMSNVFDLFEMMPIIDIDTVDELFAGEKFNGTGPFVMEEYNPGQGFYLDARTRTTGSMACPISTVSISTCPCATRQSMLSSLKSGQSQLALDLAPLDGATITNDPQYDLVVVRCVRLVYYARLQRDYPVALGQQGPAGDRIRDRPRPCARPGVRRRSAASASLPWSPSTRRPSTSRKAATYYSDDLDKAKELIDAAGATGQPVNVVYNAGFAPNLRPSPRSSQFNLNEAGLDAEHAAAAGRPTSSPSCVAAGCDGTVRDRSTASVSSSRPP